MVYNLVMENKLVIFDGNSIAYRAFFGLPLLKDKNGEYTNAIFGFLNMMLKCINDHKPTHIVVVFDYPLKENFRTKMYADYKKTRKPMPEALVEQMPKLCKLIKKLGITVFQEKGVEADDVIGTLSKKFNEKTIIVTGDRDALQLIDDTTSVLLTKRGLSETLLLTNDNFFENYGFDPINIIDLKAVMGDKSDNIPGIKGVGEKGATDIIKKFKSLDNIYEHLDELTPRQEMLFKVDRDMAYLSKALATINTNVEIPEVKFETLKLVLPFNSEAREEFRILEFNSLLKNEKLFSQEEINFVPEQVKFEEKKYKTINLTTIDELKKFVNSFNKDKLSFIYDENEVLLASDDETQYRVAIKQNLIDDGLDFFSILKTLKEILENEKIQKFCFNYKNIKHYLHDFGINFNGLSEDIKIAEWLVSSNIKDQDIKNLFLSYGHLKVSACGLIDICKKIENEQIKSGIRDLYKNVEIKLVDVLYSMENNGIKVDDKIRSELENYYINKTNELQEKIFEVSAQIFNLQSPKQVADVLYNKLKLGNIKWGTNIQTLRTIEDKHPVVPFIIEYRKYIKLLSTYILPFKLERNNTDNLVHTTFNQTGTITGRLSSNNPNMQNIPARSSEGREVRKMFVSRFEGGELVSADYNQIELRLLAHYSNDETLVKSYINNEDIHRLTASQIFGVPYDQVTEEQRKHSKATNFGIIYGISPFGLSEQIGVSPKVAEEFINNYYKHFSSVKNYLDGIVINARNNDGYVETLMGRKRRITELFHKNKMLQKFGERATKNFPFQGSASDIIKVAMINVMNKLKEGNYKSLLCLQIHDELIFDCVKEEVELVKELAKKEMENVIKLKVPLIANVDSGNSLFDI